MTDTLTPEKLEPCPFCGHDRARLTLPRLAINTVECGECGATTRGFSQAQWSDPEQAGLQAAAAWNRRPEPPSLPADGDGALPASPSVPSQLEVVASVRLSSDCICVVSGNGQEGCGLCNETGVRHVMVDEDDLADAISDSIDMGWNARDGARAVIRLLRESATGAPPSLGTQSQSDGVDQ